MKKVFMVLILTALLTVPGLASADAKPNASGNIFIAKDTPIAVELVDSVSSHSTFVGETLMVSVLEDVIINNVVVIEKSSKGYVSVVDMKRSGDWGKAGGVAIKPQYVKSANWVKVPLSGQVQTSGKSHSIIIPLFGATAGKGWSSDIASDFGAFASVLVFSDPSPGKEASIPAGTKLILTVSEAVDLGVTSETLATAMTAEAVRRSHSEQGAAQNWSGVWTSSRGKIILTQTKGSSAVTGTYERGNGQLIGLSSLSSAGRLKGTWTEDKSDRAPSGRGEFEFLLSDNGKAVLMLWKHDFSENWMEDKLGARVSGF